jgi:prepilin-type N-terminal cleavage/methylation domain-containing protein
VHKKQSAFTLTEVLVALSIIAILAGICYAVFAPAREKARHSVCVSQLKQWYQAYQMYATDNEGPEQLPGLGDFKLIPPLSFRDAMHPYLKDARLWHCPDSTERMRKSFATTYFHNLIWEGDFPAQDSGDLRFEPPESRLTQALAANGQETPIMICQVHDELFYQPREKDVDPALLKGFEIRLLLNGSVVQGRFGEIRSKVFSK